jgi:hypothetical protein
VSHIVIHCAQCAKVAELAREGRFCSTACRVRYHRARLVAQRQRLQAEAETAITSGDVARLEDVARRAVSLLAV